MHQNLLCILIHILKTSTQSFSSMPPSLEAFFFLSFLSYLDRSSVPQCCIPQWKPKLITFESWKSINIRLQNKKREIKQGHIPLDEPKLPK